jgi:predicted amidohydrolase YtcJ
MISRRALGALLPVLCTFLPGALSWAQSDSPRVRATPPVADLIVTHAKIYTADAHRSTADALAVREGKLIYVGDAHGARAFMGPKTRVRNLQGRRVLPGLVDSHIHPTDIVEYDVCDLHSRVVSLAELAAFVQGCVDRYHIAPGEWVSVREWDFMHGNQPDAGHPSLRAALDVATTVNPVHVLGNDWHHSAFNSMALAGAKNAAGVTVGLSRATLATEFAPQRLFVGVDAGGEPDGGVTEAMQHAVDGPGEYAAAREDFAALMRAPERVTERLNSVGITAVLDAKVPPNNLQFYDALARAGRLTVRATLAQYYPPEQYLGTDGKVDFERMVSQAKAVRAKYAGGTLLRADVVKLFADGGIEGNPYGTPERCDHGVRQAIPPSGIRHAHSRHWR